MDNAYYCLQHLRENDKFAYLTTLLIPYAHRRDIVILNAFQVEIARIRFMVTEAIPGEIRLQWWRDALNQNQTEAKANPLAEALLEIIEKHNLPKQDFDKILLARAFDLYNDPLPLWSDFETYAGETRSLFLRLTCLVCGIKPSKNLATACGHAGIALAIQQILQNFACDAARGQIYIPSDVLIRAGADKEKIINGEMHEGLKVTLNDMAKLGREHYNSASLALSSLPKDAKIALGLSLACILPVFKIFEKEGFNPYKKSSHLSQINQQWLLMKARYFL